jgi:hypothetical protein
MLGRKVLSAPSPFWLVKERITEDAEVRRLEF